MIYLSDHKIEEPRLWPGTFILPGTFGICAGTNMAGALTQWMREQWYRDTEGGSELPFHRMELEASQVPAGSEGLICLPYFAGERTPINDSKARGVFFGLETGHTRGHMVRAGIEGKMPFGSNAWRIFLKRRFLFRRCPLARPMGTP